MSESELQAPGLKLTLEYDGAPYVGWQTQPNGPSVQSVVQAAIERLCGAAPGSVRINGAGRTDSGVHARGQVASLLPPPQAGGKARLPLKAWTAGLNALLPPQIACVRAEEVDPRFDARRWARGKRYVYSLVNSPVRSPLWRARAWEVRRPFDVAAMQAALPYMLGAHDFSALRASDCPARTTVREIRALSLEREGGALVLRIVASAFLKHMVRNIVGTLVEVGHGKRSPESLAALLAGRDRTRAGPTAPPHGLVLDEVFYLAGNADPRSAAAPAADEDPGDE